MTTSTHHISKTRRRLRLAAAFQTVDAIRAALATVEAHWDLSNDILNSEYHRLGSLLGEYEDDPEDQMEQWLAAGFSPEDFES